MMDKVPKLYTFSICKASTNYDEKKTRVPNTNTQHPRWVVLYLTVHYHIGGQLDNTFF